MEPYLVIGRQLAQRHAQPADLDPAGGLIGYAEALRVRGWSLRSALVRLAQPEPDRAGAVLEQVRRCDGALHGLRRSLEQTPARTDRALRWTDLAAQNPPALPDAAVDPVGDIRAADLARLLPAGEAEFGAILTGYTEVAATKLTDDELVALPLLGVAVELSDLGDALATWAIDDEPATPPVDRIDRVVAATGGVLDAVGVPRETGPPEGFRGRRGRG